MYLVGMDVVGCYWYYFVQVGLILVEEDFMFEFGGIEVFVIDVVVVVCGVGVVFEFVDYCVGMDVVYVGEVYLFGDDVE